MFIVEIDYPNGNTVYVGPFPNADAADDYIDAALAKQPKTQASYAACPLQAPTN